MVHVYTCMCVAYCPCFEVGTRYAQDNLSTLWSQPKRAVVNNQVNGNCLHFSIIRVIDLYHITKFCFSTPSSF